MQRSRLSMLRQLHTEGSGDACNHDGRWLGGFDFGGAATPTQALLARPGLPRLAGLPRFEVWYGEAAVRAGVHKAWRWRRDDTWLWAECRFRGEDLEALTRLAYQQLFELLDAQGPLHLQRLWNYLRDINGELNGLERYRHFNSGRQQAFVDAQRSAFKGAPAACALGLPGGPDDAALDDLCISMLAAREPCTAVENPRQVSAYDYPRDYGPRAPSFSRAARVRVGDDHEALLISGTASIVGHASVHTGDVVAQTREILVNLQALLQAAALPRRRGFRLDALLCTVYLRRAEDLEAVREVFEKAVGAGSFAAQQAVYLQADICRRDLLVEIEAHCP